MKYVFVASCSNIGSDFFGFISIVGLQNNIICFEIDIKRDIIIPRNMGKVFFRESYSALSLDDSRYKSSEMPSAAVTISESFILAS